MPSISEQAVGGSYRDPSGFVFLRDGQLYRQVNHVYREAYVRLRESGLYDELVSRALLIPHEEVTGDLAFSDLAYKVIRPERVPLISYPWEWAFSQYKAAALLTLAIQTTALSRGMTLKDSSAFNVQFRGCRPVFIDTLSFERYVEGEPWVAYRQFCTHFLAPMCLMAFRDVRLGQLSRIYLDGLPLDLVSSLLPLRAKLKPAVLSHICAHAKMEKRLAGKAPTTPRRTISKQQLLAIVAHLQRTIESLRWNPDETLWAQYYSETNYSPQAMDHKEALVANMLDIASPRSVWDLGANTGNFSRLGSRRGIPTVAFDMDPGAVEQNYLRCVREKENHLLPLVLDVTNPSSGCGWANKERMSLLERGPAEAVLALALVHHLAIVNNVPLQKIAQFVSEMGCWLIIEFIPKEDSQVQRLLATRKDVFSDYRQDEFERQFAKRYDIVKKAPIIDSKRVLYLMRARG